MSASGTVVESSQVPSKSDKDSFRRRPAASDFFERYGLLLVFAGTSIVFGILRPDTFLTYATLRTILSTQSVLAVAALALIIPLIGGRFDISVGANLGLSSLVAASCMQNYSLPLIAAIVLGIATGPLVGLVNGFLVAYLGVNAIISTLGVTIVIQGLVIAYTGGIPVSNNLSRTLTNLSVTVLVYVPALFVLMLIVAAGTWFLLRQTPYGRYLQAVGSNLNAARLTGIPVSRIVMLSFVFAGVLAGVAGVLQIGAQGNADPQVGSINFILPALAAAFLGATTWKPGTYNVVGTLIALFFLSTVVSGLSLLGVAPWVTDVFNGAAVIVAITVSAQFRRRRTGTLDVGI